MNNIFESDISGLLIYYELILQILGKAKLRKLQITMCYNHSKQRTKRNLEKKFFRKQVDSHESHYQV